MSSQLVQKQALTGAINPKLQLTSIVGRVVFKEDPSRSYYYLVNFDNGMCAWCWPKDKRMTKDHWKRFATLVLQFDKAYPKNWKDTEKTAPAGIQTDNDNGNGDQESKEVKQAPSGGKIKKENLPRAAIRPPPGYPACSFSWKEKNKILAWFGYNGFHDVIGGKEEQARMAAESTQDADDGIRCYDAAFFAEASKPRPSAKLKPQAKGNWDLVSEDGSDTEEKRFQAAAGNNGLERSDRRTKLMSSPVKRHTGASSAELIMGTNVTSRFSKEVKKARSGQCALSSKATVRAILRLESIAEEPVAAENVPVSEKGPGKRKLAPKLQQPGLSTMTTAAGRVDVPLNTRDVTEEESQADSEGLPQSSAKVTCIGDPAEDVNDPRQKSAPKIIMRCTRSAANGPDTGWSNLTQRTTTNVFPPTMEFHPGGPNIKWVNLSLREVGPVLYIIGWAETGVSGVPNEHRQFVQHGDIVKMVGRDELNRFEKTKTAARRHELAFGRVKNVDAIDEERKQGRDTWDASYATEQRLRLMGFGEEISVIDCDHNVVQIQGQKGNDPKNPKAVVSSAEVARFWSLHEQREQARKRVEAVDREIEKASKHLLAGHQLPSNKRYDEASGLELLDYTDMHSLDEEEPPLGGLIARDLTQAAPVSCTELEPVTQSDRPMDLSKYPHGHPIQTESSLGRPENHTLQRADPPAKQLAPILIPLADAESSLNVANRSRTIPKHQLDKKHEERPRLQPKMSFKRTREDYELDANEDSDEGVIPSGIPVAKKSRQSLQDTPPTPPALLLQTNTRVRIARPHIKVKDRARKHNVMAREDIQISAGEIASAAQKSGTTTDIQQTMTSTGTKVTNRRETAFVEISDNEDDEL
jgi:hypothetical protein